MGSQKKKQNDKFTFEYTIGIKGSSIYYKMQNESLETLRASPPRLELVSDQSL